MKKKILLFLILSIVNISLLYGEDQTEKLVRKSDSIYRMVNDKLVKLNNKVVTVKLKEGKVLSKNAKAIRSNVLGYIDVEVPNDTDIEDFVANLKSTGDYELVKYNVIGEIGVSSNDTGASNQWYLGAINMFSTWNITTGSPTIKVAVIDGGFDCTHEDIGYGNDNYRNIDPTLGYDYYQMSSTSMTKRDHGTQVAGIISAKTNNGTGIAGVAGGFGASGVTILPFCVTDGTPSGVDFGYIDDAICLAVNNGAKVINMSFGTNDINLSHHTDIVDAIDYAYSHGVTLVSITHNYNNSFVWFPACYSKVIAVGAMNQDYQRSTFSNYGNGLDLVAPGEGIYSTQINNGYDYDLGTSFAAPQVAGVVALMLSVNPSLTPGQIMSKIRSTCTKLSGYSYNNGWNSYVGYGLLNAYAAVSAALSTDSEIVGPELVYSCNMFYVENLSSYVDVIWSVDDSYYDSHLTTDFPAPGQCVLFRATGHDMMNGTLTADIYYNNVLIQTLTKTVSAYDDFWGQYTSGDLSGTVNYTHYFNVRQGCTTRINSPNFYGATSVTYDGSAATPSFWWFNPTDGFLEFSAPVNYNAPSMIIINVTDKFLHNYQLYASASGIYYLNVSPGENSITVTLNEDGESERGMDFDQSWTVEVRNATTGQLMDSQSSTSQSETISTAGWPKGIYIVKVTIGTEVLTEKVIVR